jgi:hypothetical protein
MSDDQKIDNAAALKSFQQDMMNYDSDYAAHYQKAQADDARDYFKGVQNQQIEQAPISAQGQQQDMTAQGAIQTAGKAAGAVAKDVGLGVVQAPRSVARGAIKGVNSMIGFLEGVTDLMPAITLLNEQGEMGAPRVTTTGEKQERQGTRINKQRAEEGKEPVEFGAAPQLPVPGKPAVGTVTGGLIEGITQFAVGLKGVDKLGKVAGVAKLAKDAGAAQKAAAAIGKGTLADVLAFDQHEQRLSNVIQQVPALQNPVTEYLMARDDDGFAEGKLKQAIEGAGLGLAGEVLGKAVTLMKRGKSAVRDMKAGGLTPDDLQNLPLSAQTGETFQKAALNTLGDVDDPRLLIPREAKPAQAVDDAGTAAVKKLSKASKATKDTTPGMVQDAAKSDLEGDIMINFARIEGPEDIKRAMQELANDPRLAPDVIKARRGTITDEQLLKNADDVDGFSTLMERRVGGTLNDQQTIAARKLYYDATDKLIEAAKKAGENTASNYDQYVFRRMLAIHHAVQQDLLGARAEAARALRAWSIPVGGGNLDRLRGIEEALDNFGGVEATQDLAKRLTQMSQAGKMTTDQINQVARGGALARTGKALQEAWSLGLLTSPRTHVVNVSSNVFTGLTLGAERYGMAAQGDIPLREANEFMVGYLGSFRQAMGNAAQAWKTGQTGFGMGKIEAPFERATAREVLDPEGKAGIFSKALDWYGAALNRYVGGTLAAGDEFGKTTLYNAQLRAMATRQAQRLGLKGADATRHIADTVSNPPPMMRSEAIEFANYGTFTNALGAGGAGAQKAINKIPGAKFIVPFVRTPLNIFKFTFERTPLGLVSQSIREDIAAGGVRKASAMAKLGMGTSVMMLGTDMAMNGEITGAGPVDPEIRSRLMAAGWKPYSIKIDDKYYSYARFEPFATWLGMSADMTEILGNYESYDIAAQDEIDELGTAMVAAIANQVVGKTFMQGISDLTQVLSDSKRYGAQYLQRYAGSLVPNAVADIEKMVSPEREQVFSMMDGIKARIPGLSDTVGKRYNVYGEVIKNYYPDPDSRAIAFTERAMQAFNPVFFSDKDAPSQKLDEWFLSSGVDGPNMPQKTQKFDVPGDFTGGKVAVDLREYPEIFQRFMQLRGEITLPQYEKSTMKEYLIKLVNQEVPYSKVFFHGMAKNREEQAAYISGVVADYDRAIRKQLVDEYPVLRQTIAEERTKQMPLQENAGGQGLVRTKPFP